MALQRTSSRQVVDQRMVSTTRQDRKGARNERQVQRVVLTRSGTRS